MLLQGFDPHLPGKLIYLFIYLLHDLAGVGPTLAWRTHRQTDNRGGLTPFRQGMLLQGFDPHSPGAHTDRHSESWGFNVQAEHALAGVQPTLA